MFNHKHSSLHLDEIKHSLKCYCPLFRMNCVKCLRDAVAITA